MSDLKLDIERLIDLYRDQSSLKENSLNNYVNLILFYWDISFDYGLESYCITKNVFSKEEILNFPKKVEGLFENAFKEYPTSKELLFWKMYIKEINSFSSELCKKEILELSDDKFLLPYFYLKVQCGILNSRKLKDLKAKLLKEDDSYNKHYLLSYLEEISIP